MANDNFKASNNIASILNSMNDYTRKKNRNSFYYSINGLYMHLLHSSITILAFIMNHYPSQNIILEKYHIMPYKVAKERQLRCDMHLVNLCSTLSEEEIEQNVNFYSSHISIGSLMIKYFVHAAHHRGQISQILDEIKINIKEEFEQEKLPIIS